MTIYLERSKSLTFDKVSIKDQTHRLGVGRGSVPQLTETQRDEKR